MIGNLLDSPFESQMLIIINRQARVTKYQNAWGLIERVIFFHITEHYRKSFWQ